MPRWLWWSPLVVLTLWLALHFLRLGWIATRWTETDVIETYAQKYLQDRSRDGTGGQARLDDCLAYSGEARGVWLIISCGPRPMDPALHYEYHVDRWGRLLFVDGPSLAPEA